MMLFHLLLCGLLMSIGYCLPSYKQGYGSLFVKESTLHTSAHSWTISFELNLKSYEDTATNLSSSIDAFLQEFHDDL